MQYSHKSRKVLITGSSGCGKTTYLLDLLSKEKTNFAFIFDPEGEFSDKTKFRPARTCNELTKSAGQGRVVYDPSFMFPGATQRGFNFFADFTFTLATRLPGRKLFVCDELQKFIGTSNADMPHELALILETGRRYALDGIFVAQSPNLIHTRVRNQLTEIVTFRQVDERAKKFLVSLGFPEQQLAGLTPGKYLSLALNTGKFSSGKVF